MSYVTMEILEGANQYKCESCNKHVDALKVCFKNQHMNHHKLPNHNHFLNVSSSSSSLLSRSISAAAEAAAAAS